MDIDLKSLALPAPYDEPAGENALWLAAACEWVERHTEFRFGEGEETPAGVKLFLIKFCEAAESGAANGIESERLAGTSQAGMGQSFAQVGFESLLRQWACELLGEYYKAVKFVPAEDKWV